MATRLIRDKPQSLADALNQRRSGGRLRRWAWLTGCVLAALCLMLAWLSMPVLPGGEPVMPGISAVAAAPAPAECPDDVTALQAELTALAAGFNGKAGIAVTKVGCNWLVGERIGELFPQQSVSKLWVALSVFDAVDRGKLNLDDELEIGTNDLTLFHQPMRAAVLESGAVRRPVLSLLSDALSHSDNTANDRLLWAVGGPDTVKRVLASRDIDGIRFGPGERLLQSRIAGLDWSQDLSFDRRFYDARARLPFELRDRALTNYLADPMDGATPSGIVRSLVRLAEGGLLSPQSTAVMMDILSQTRSGPRRLKGGAFPGWTVYHKTGTGQVLRQMQTGYNDVGILQAPDGTRYAVAVMIANTTAPNPARMELMQNVTRAVSRFHEAAPGPEGEIVRAGDETRIAQMPLDTPGVQHD